MKKVNILLYTLSVTLTVLLLSCSKGEDGAQGPAGPAGAAGAAGAPGAPGPAGTANVIYSPWIDTLHFLPIKDTNGTIVDTIGYFADITAPRVDIDMLDKGQIKVYMNLGTAADPVVFPIPFNNGVVFIDAIFFLGTIELNSNADLTALQLPFRYILIPGGTPARSANSIDWNDYKQVQKYLGLKD